MGDVHSRRSPPLPSPPETVSPAAVTHPPHLQSPSNHQIADHDHSNNLSMDSIVDSSLKAGPPMPRFSRGDSGDQLHGLTPITEDTRSENEQHEDQGRSSQTLKELRRQMEELLVYQQMQQQYTHSAVPNQSTVGHSNETPKKRRLSNAPTEIPPTIVPPSSGSIGSGGTIKADDSQSTTSTDQTVFQTPSYPFPRVQNQYTQPEFEQSGRQGQFRLKLPSERFRASTPGSQTSEDQQSVPRPLSAQPAFLPPQSCPPADNSEYPTPSLYDLTLKLNADPGLEAWWSNLIEVLQTNYGAERVSLAVPGDLTDLENVPWGQKAVFNQQVPSIPEDTPLSAIPDATLSDYTIDARTYHDEVYHDRSSELAPSLKNPASSRPRLESRHSFAGFGYGKRPIQTSELDRRQQVPKTSVKSEKKQARIAGASNLMEMTTASSSRRQPTTQSEANDPPIIAASSLRQAVFPIPRPLEVESDPLVKRAGVVKLFGRTTPVVLTRDYSTDAIDKQMSGNHMPRSPNETIQKTPNADGPYKTADHGQSAPAISLSAAGLRHYDEYEQVPQSPWSQSPAPSPAPRMHADQNPFFTCHTVDEGAFSKNPPHHDYSNPQPLEAIGIDHSKTVVHIPLLHGGHADQSSHSTLRFPVAVISLLSTIVPYPPNLRQSLAHLMPHLTTSFCLAQQYSQLERQVTSKVDTPRYGHFLGLGGTFSDASSELELVAGLSGHVSYSVGDDSSMSAQASITSPSDRSSNMFSPAISSLGTPGFELGQMALNSATQSPALFSRSGDATDSYFNVQHPRAARDNFPTQRSRLSKTKSSLSSSTPTSPGRLPNKSCTGEEANNGQDPASIVTSPSQEVRPQNVLSPTQQPSRQGSTNSFYAQIQRDIPRPFSDTIAQLMLNSVPLHLFLAKPQSGEVIWTNAKFDAYRRSKPQEQRVRDPWQNVHSSERDHLASEWSNALRTGSQFTERVRVRRYNDETAYRWFIFRANPLLSSTGEVLYWIGSFLDIHEQHISELKATQEREKFATDAKYRAFSNSIPQVVFEATENRGLIFVNEQWNLYTGQSLEEALNLGFAKHVHPNDLEKCGGLAMQAHVLSSNEEVKSTSDNGQGRSSESHGVSSALDELVRRGVASLQKDENGRVFYSTEIRLRSRGGDFRWHLVRLVRVETGSFGSEEASWYGTCTDINDRKNLERELNKAMTQLNNQMESKTKFFSNMSHEIRTPLNGILGTIPFILDTQLDTDQRRMLDTIQNSSTNLRELVDNILDVSRVEAGKMSMVKSWFHVRSMIEDVIDTVASRAIDKGLEINYLMEADVPSMVIGDRFRIRQVLINLVGNAVKFTAHGEVYISCNLLQDSSAKLKDTEAFLSFDVVDTGKGFSSEDAERLMQRFSQLGESASQQHAGSGLGLFLSKQLVEMHGGKLTPSSKEGQGARFSFNVKVDAPPPPSPSERPSLLRHASTVSRRPATSRTTSYDQSNSLALNPALNLATLSLGLDSPEFDLGPKSLYPSSAASSALPTPDLSTAHAPPVPSSSVPLQTDSKDGSPGAPVHLNPLPHGSSSPSRLSIGSPPVPPHGPFSIIILCPLDNTRKATKQHIEQVVPYEIPFKITTLPDIDEWKDVMQPGLKTPCTHLVLNLPATDDILEVIQHVSESEPEVAPVVVIIADLYQKRQISTRVKELAATGKQVFIVPKPVKPSAFSTIFDPGSKRELSKDRNQDMAREINNNFKTVSKMVKEVLGNKGYRILLVEDDETNRDVMLKYLDKLKLMSETASNGQECTDMVLSKEPGYYSLIICDIQMPIKNGYDTCREIRAWEQKNHYPQIPIMALSANAMTDQIENAARAGFNDYVTKPIKHNELGKMMMGLLDPSRPLQLLRDRLSGEGDVSPSIRR
ncbi:Peroxide stress-activated histidine kinase mak1 [Penicillium rolfsii]|nr:Peroxide stress-activated histidine kinase mak1 [Penicillium rolfsii]